MVGLGQQVAPNSEGRKSRRRELDRRTAQIVGLRKQTVRALKNWLQERNQYDIYSDSDKLWLTRGGNPYQTDSLNYILRKLRDIADIDANERSVTWMTLRESLGVHLAKEGDL